MYNADPGAGIVLLLIIVVFAIAVFFVCREIVCWYFKINRIVEDLGVIADHYRRLAAAEKAAAAPPLRRQWNPLCTTRALADRTRLQDASPCREPTGIVERARGKPAPNGHPPSERSSSSPRSAPLHNAHKTCRVRWRQIRPGEIAHKA